MLLMTWMQGARTSAAMNNDQDALEQHAQGCSIHNKIARHISTGNTYTSMVDFYLGALAYELP